MTVIGWRAWYADGSCYDSRRLTPEALPRDGLQIVVVYFDGAYKNIYCGGDYLIWNGHQWQSAMDAPTCPTCRVFPGRWMPDAAFAALQAEAMTATF